MQLIKTQRCVTLNYYYLRTREELTAEMNQDDANGRPNLYQWQKYAYGRLVAGRRLVDCNLIETITQVEFCHDSVITLSYRLNSLLEVIAAKISLLEDMDSESAHMVAASKVPMLKP
ncbi:hypothetical protein Tco_1169870, partial [Tanacetum coccineum]